MANTDRLEIALKHIEFVRSYTLTLLEDLTDEDYFWTPDPGFTHIAWQMGHMAMAQYGLTLFRQRGRAEVDSDLMSSKFRKLFAKGSKPELDVGLYPSVSEIRDVFNGVYQQMQKEWPTLTEEGVDEEIGPPTAGYNTKYGALLFAADHEMLHAGQIGLLRRLMGKSPVR